MPNLWAPLGVSASLHFTSIKMKYLHRQNCCRMIIRLFQGSINLCILPVASGVSFHRPPCPHELHRRNDPQIPCARRIAPQAHTGVVPTAQPCLVHTRVGRDRACSVTVMRLRLLELPSDPPHERPLLEWLIARCPCPSPSPRSYPRSGAGQGGGALVPRA